MRKPNIVFVYADDMGRGMLSSYGQKVIRTPNIDRLAAEGMRFENCCANAFCAPARASLLCGIHDCHAGGWTYTPGAYYKKISTGELTFEELQEILNKPHMDDYCRGEYMATLLSRCGYHTAEIGKLEWGFATTPQEMEAHGWQYHYGYYDHISCHGYYPPFLFENGKMVHIEGNTDPQCGRCSYYTEDDMPYDMSARKVYSQDLFDEKIAAYIEQHQHEPFFLFHPSQLPHGPVFYKDLYPCVKDDPNLTEKEKQYASMVLRLDETVGKIYRQLEELKLLEHTVFLFASDNGHVVGYRRRGRSLDTEQLDGTPVDNLNHPFRTATCGDVFNGNDGMAGLKFTNWNGGVFVPLIIRYPAMIQANQTCASLVAPYDLLATFVELAGGARPNYTDGRSMVPLLRGEDVTLHDAVYFASKDGPAMVTSDGWKLRTYVDKSLWNTAEHASLILNPNVVFQLYNLREDFAETHDLAQEKPELVEKLKKKLLDACNGNLYNGTPMAHLIQPLYPVPSWPEIVDGVI